MDTDNQILLVVDDKDNFIRYENRKTCHLGKGVHHRAFVVLIENSKGEILLQKRKHKLWDNFWDTTAISHPLHLGTKNESYEEAGNRSLMDEMGIRPLSLENIGGFNYFAKHGENCENEYCAILTGLYEGDVVINPDAVYEYKWIPKSEFIESAIKKDPTLTPWAILTGELLAKHEK